MYEWLEQFLYCYECKEIRKEFNLTPGKHLVPSNFVVTLLKLSLNPNLTFLLSRLGIPKQTPLEGTEEKRARRIMTLAAALEDGESL